MVAVYAATGESATKQLLQAKMGNTVALPEGALKVESMEDRVAVG